MRARVGIELSPVACRLVELEGPAIEPGQPPATRVRSYAVLPPSGPETNRHLAALGRRPAAVVLWGVRSDHRQVVVANGSYESMRTEALASARTAGVETRGTLADIATASTAIKGADRQPVVLALASLDEVSAAVQPLRDAGVRIRSIITPADALLGLARSRRAFAVPGGIEAYVALDETATCVALVRDGSLLSARELPWGYAGGTGVPSPSAAAEVQRRDDLATRLLDELTGFVATVGPDGSAVAQVSICGGLPELRTMTVPLMERLDVEVEALDSLFGIDVERLPEPADEFREQASALRLAWAAGADWRGPINLMRHRQRRNRRVAVARAAVIAGVAAGLGTGWAIQRSAWWQATTPQPVARRTPAATPPVTSPALARGTATPRPATPTLPAPTAATPSTTSMTSIPGPVPPAPAAAPPAIAAMLPPSNAPASARPPTPTAPVAPAGARGITATNVPVPPRVATPSPAAAKPPASTPPAARATPPAVTPPVARATPPAVTPPVVRATSPAAAPVATPPSAAAKPPASTPPVARATPPVVTPPVVRATPPAAAPGAAAPPPPPARQPVPATPSPVVPPIARPVPPATVAVAPPVAPRPSAPAPSVSAGTVPARAGTEELAVPFDAVLGTILYSPDRKLAIVNGRIVGPGDAVNGARIIDITPGVVLLRDVQGRLRSLTLGPVGRSVTAP